MKKLIFVGLLFCLSCNTTDTSETTKQTSELDSLEARAAQLRREITAIEGTDTTSLSIKTTLSMHLRDAQERIDELKGRK
jgi:TolA-binding protein